MTPFTKHRPDAPAGFFDVEAAGLRWLAEAGGLRIAEVLATADDRIVLARVAEVEPAPAAAAAFGPGLAAVHRAGAPHHGAPPAGWQGDGFIATLPLPHLDDAGPGWPDFYARCRLAPYVRLAADRGALGADDVLLLDRVVARTADGSLDLPEPAPARLHGDLWQGNVLWSHDGVVLVDPAAHGGSRETDLAMLVLLGLPYLDRVLAAYDEAWPLDDGWRDRVALHQLHPLLVHTALFGGAYGGQAVSAARRYA